MKQNLWSVSALVKYLKSGIDSDPILNHVLIKGEISNFTAHRSGHYYFTLKDASARMSCIMFASYTSKVRFPIKEGCKVIAAAKVSMYEAGGTLQLYVMDLQLDGLGDLYLQLEEVKRKLHAEGLFEETRKKALPLYPMDIAFLSARDGAATQDVFTTLKRRWPLAKVTFYPTSVQGVDADKEVMAALKKADQNNHEVILVVRGGGSIEDLWCFNSEALARCVSECHTPIVSGVGHETDTTLIDYVSDRRAPTPTAAAELVTPKIDEVQENLVHLKARMQVILSAKIKAEKLQLNRMKSHPLMSDPLSYVMSDVMHLDYQRNRIQRLMENMQLEQLKLDHFQQQMKTYASSIKGNNVFVLNQTEKRLKTSMTQLQVNHAQQLTSKISLLDAYSPLKILLRGYSLTYTDNQLVHSVNDVDEGNLLCTHLADGKITSKILTKEKQNGK